MTAEPRLEWLKRISHLNPLKREESVGAEHYLIFVAVVEDCLAESS